MRNEHNESQQVNWFKLDPPLFSGNTKIMKNELD